VLAHVDYSNWLQHLKTVAASTFLLESLGWQLAVIALAYSSAWVALVAIRPWIARTAVVCARRYPMLRMPGGLRRLGLFCWAWLLLVIAARAFEHLGFDYRLIDVAASLTVLWIVIRASALLVRDPLLARAVAAIAWIVAALEIIGLLPATEAALDSAALTIGAVRISLLMVLKGLLLVAILVWAALALARLIDASLLRVTTLSPSLRALSSNLARIILVSVALLIGLDLVGIDLTAFAVFSGAVGVGLGFGLQKVVSNFVSGIILLLERSIKPGDVIELGDTFGSVTYLGARYAAVRGRDGKEYLIPNENLITNQVVNWSYSNSLVRLHTEFGVAYSSDLHRVRKIAIETALATKRVLSWPAPLCHVTGFGDSSVNLLLVFWIEDPSDGIINIKGDVLLGLWDAFHANGVEFPFPQRDIHIRDFAPAAAAFAEAAPVRQNGETLGSGLR
jgi:small-conductance mechanosensitive channel